MATDRPGLALGILTADCTPILFADSRSGVIGAAHAGWKGAFDGVLENIGSYTRTITGSWKVGDVESPIVLRRE